MKTFKGIITAFTLAATPFVVGCYQTPTSHSPAEHADSSHSSAEHANTADEPAAKADIVDTAVGAGSFSTLVAAVKAADLADVLKSEGPFTVFAPTDEAFAKLPPGTVEDLLKPENKDKLKAVLTYHVVAGRVGSAEVVNLTEADTVQGSKLLISATDAGVRINDANVIQTDVNCTNGVIHVIDTVIISQS